MKVPLLDLKQQYESIRQETLSAVERVLSSCAYAGGPFVQEFEESFAAYCGCKYARGVGSGTEALWLALKAVGVREGDEVITVANTFIATAEAISMCGATPVFVDVEMDTQTMDPALIESAITPRTRAVLPVHLYGQIADMDPIMETAREHGLAVVEDAAQAHGAEYKGKRAGSYGDAACFSFYPSKNLGAYGEAGAVVSNRSDVVQCVSALRDHGQAKRYYHDAIGWNCRMDGIQGAVLNVKLKYLEEWNEARREHAASYRDILGQDKRVVIPVEKPGRRHVYYVYPILVSDRDDVREELTRQDVHCAVHYPVPIHKQIAYQDGGARVAGTLTNTESYTARCLSLPMFPELTESQIQCVTGSLSNLLAQGAHLEVMNA